MLTTCSRLCSRVSDVILDDGVKTKVDKLLPLVPLLGNPFVNSSIS